MLETQLASWIAYAALLLIAVSGTLAIGASMIARTLPGRVREDVETAESRLTNVEREMIELKGQWAVTLEQLEAIEASVEKKRRSNAAYISRMKQEQQNADGDEPATMEDQLAAIRRQVYGASNGAMR